jgi:hypothetical protein
MPLRSLDVGRNSFWEVKTELARSHFPHVSSLRPDPCDKPRKVCCARYKGVTSYSVGNVTSRMVHMDKELVDIGLR